MTRALVTDASGRTSIDSVELPDPGPGELVLRTDGCGLCGTDLFKIDALRRGAEPPASAEPPQVLGHELVGTVETVGDDAPFAVGQRLAVAHHVPCGRCDLCRADAETSCEQYRENLLVPGGFSERVLVRARGSNNSAFPLLDTVTDEVGLFLEPTACVLRGFDRSGLARAAGRNGRPADRPSRIAIFGCGSMGLLHLLVIRALEPEAEIVAFEPDPERRQLARQLGAEVAEPGACPRALRGRCDAAFDTVGSVAALDGALMTLRPGGTLVLFAHGAPDQTSSFDANRLFRAEHRIVATYSSGRLDQVRAHELLHRGAEVFDPSVLITHRLPFEDFDQALELAEKRRALKIVLAPSV